MPPTDADDGDSTSDPDLRQLSRQLANIEALLLMNTNNNERDWSDAKLAIIARRIYRARQRRARHFPAELFADPAWDMMLDLFIHHVDGKRVSTTSLCLAAQVSHSTCLRWIKLLKGHDLVQRYSAPDDKRLSLVDLTEKGYRLMRESLPIWTEALQGED